MPWKRTDRRNRSNAQRERWPQRSTAEYSLDSDTVSCFNLTRICVCVWLSMIEGLRSCIYIIFKRSLCVRDSITMKYDPTCNFVPQCNTFMVWLKTTWYGNESQKTAGSMDSCAGYWGWNPPKRMVILAADFHLLAMTFLLFNGSASSPSNRLISSSRAITLSMSWM